MKGKTGVGKKEGERGVGVGEEKDGAGYIHSLLSFPSIFKCSYDKGFDRAQKQAAALNA